MNELEIIKKSFYQLRDTPDALDSAIKGTVITAVRNLPKSAESFELFNLAYDLLKRIDDGFERQMAILDLSREIPFTGLFKDLYMKVMDEAIDAADSMDEVRNEAHRRTTELLRIATDLPSTPEFLEGRLRSWRLVLGLPERPRMKPPDYERVAKELPKPSDLAFYRRYTLLGIARTMPKDGPFLDVYRDAMALAIESAQFHQEPFYKRYSLVFIAHELRDSGCAHDLYMRAFADAYKAAIDTKDSFARQFAIIEMLAEIPRDQEFYPLLQEALDQALAFFTVRKWMEDVEVYDVVDYILSAEETGMTDSKQRRFVREKYANLIAGALSKLCPDLNDIRFIQTLEPYTHVWIQPRELRDAAKKVVEHLEALGKSFHGREITRPVFVTETHFAEDGTAYVNKRQRPESECVSIDLGATNTVIARKKGKAPVEFVELAGISRRFENISIVPTVISRDSNAIGTEVVDENPVTDLKQMLLDGNPQGAVYMERFFRSLYIHLKKETFAAGWLFSKNTTDILYITVPVGYQDYSAAMKRIADGVVKGSRAELIEEPLAAAVGYEVVDDVDRVMMIIDFGGSTLNTMIVRLNINEVNVIAKPERAQMLGGHDIDVWLAQYLAGKVGVSVAGEIPYKLLVAAEDIKIELSKSRDAAFVWDGLEVCRVTRQAFEEVLDSHDFYRLVDRTMSYVLRRAEKVGLKKESIEAVLLTGGSSQIPSFKEKIGDVFQSLRKKNLIYDHSPLAAVGLGAAMYGTRDITDRHLGMAYAVKYSTQSGDSPFSYTIVLEKGETLPFEKTFRVGPAKKISPQTEIYIEIFEVPESQIARRWVSESGIEFIKQEMVGQEMDVPLKSVKIVALPFDGPVDADVLVTFCVGMKGELLLKYGADAKTVDASIRLQ